MADFCVHEENSNESVVLFLSKSVIHIIKYLFMKMKKFASIFVATLFIFPSVFSTATIAYAEDEIETQLKQIELQHEAEKKTAENATEAQKREIEINYEAKKREIENNREAEKKSAELDEDGDKESNSDADEDENKGEGDLHRSAVAKFVLSLDALASTTDRSIGEQVREVAREQNDSKDKTADSLKELESRGAFVKFLIGANRESIKALEVSMTETQSHIDVLTQLQVGMTSETKAVLANQIELLVKEKARIKVLVDANKGKSGLFGWLVGMF